MKTRATVLGLLASIGILSVGWVVGASVAPTTTTSTTSTGLDTTGSSSSSGSSSGSSATLPSGSSSVKDGTYIGPVA
ncbi:MAG: hypothetical protein JWQ59_2033, partial [Cryobacterium sp.]|nr:hypothetical protein [Cryobacterium sp.]